MGPPGEKDREEIFCVHLRKMPCSSDVSIKELACLTEGYTGADISLICREAAISAIEVHSVFRGRHSYIGMVFSDRTPFHCFHLTLLSSYLRRTSMHQR